MNEIDDLLNLGGLQLQSLHLPEFFSSNLEVDILRLDKIHPVISGNKWFKLKYYLKDAQEKHATSIVTFGGAWSNHIIATAYISRLYNIKSIGIIRGERSSKLSQTLIDAEEYGMTLEFVDRKTYSNKNDETFKMDLLERFGEAYFVPEGGAGFPGIAGSKEILQSTESGGYSHIICCIGTGTMFTGILHSSKPGQEIIGIPVLKGIAFLPDKYLDNKQKNSNWKIMYDYHFGGYAKKTSELIHFINNFYLRTGVPTDFVYTGKLVFALFDMVAKNYFPENSKILVVHSGGLQGNASLPAGTLFF